MSLRGRNAVSTVEVSTLDKTEEIVVHNQILRCAQNDTEKSATNLFFVKPDEQREVFLCFIAARKDA